MKCVHAGKGCEWKGTIDTIETHATCTYGNESTTVQTPSIERSKYKTQCYAFVDETAFGHRPGRNKVLSVDLGKFLQLVIKGNHLAKVFFYGSAPHQKDTVWKESREKMFDVNIMEHSRKVAMMHTLTKTLYQLIYSERDQTINVVFIVVTEDHDLQLPFQDALENGVCIDLWSWEDVMAQEFKQLALTHELFTTNTLDHVAQHFIFTHTLKRDVNPTHATETQTGKQLLLIWDNHCIVVHSVYGEEGGEVYNIRIYSSLRSALVYIVCQNSVSRYKYSMAVSYLDSHCELTSKRLQTPNKGHAA